jgi:tetratricopeptide (TPR) repeat protein
MQHLTRILLTSLLGFFLGAPSIAASVTDQELANIRQQRDLPQTEKLAESGDVRAQHRMGEMLHKYGRYDEAIQWYARAVENGDAKSANRVAFFYELGIGRPKDPREALAWHRKGAELGDFSSQLRYADALRRGDVLTRDETAAFQWYARAAAQREYEQRGYAFLPMAEMYEKGAGVGHDLSRAFAYAKAAELTVDDSDGTNHLKARSLRDRVAAQMSPAELAAGDRLYQSLIPDVLEARDRQLSKWTDGAVLISTFGAFIMFLMWRIRRWRRP